MHQIPLTAHAECVDGPCGDLAGLCVRADTRAVEYYVVRDTTPGHAIERLVPRGRLNPEATPVRVDCTLAELGKLQPLNVQELQAGGPSGARGPASYGQAGGLGLVDAERAPDG